MSLLFREVPVHLTRSICETTNNLPAWEPVTFREIQPENWSNDNRCYKQRGKKGQTLFHNTGRTSCWYMYRYRRWYYFKWLREGLALSANGQILLKLRPYHLVTYSVSQVGRVCFKEFGMIEFFSPLIFLFLLAGRRVRNFGTPLHIQKAPLSIMIQDSFISIPRTFYHGRDFNLKI